MLLCAIAVLRAGAGAFVGSAAAEDQSPQPTVTASNAAKLPVIAAQGPTTHVEGKILRSTRGRKGPVRLLVEGKVGGDVTVLVAPDEFCERVGLSLRVGEVVDVTGPMVKGERPILIASSITNDGKTVRIRDDQGKVIDSGPAAGGASGGGASANIGKATVGGKPASPPAQK